MPFYTTGDNRFSGFNWIVSSTPGKGTHTSVQAAIDDSIAGQTILLKDFFTEDITMIAGISIVAETESCGIKGKISCSYSGQSYLVGLGLETNLDYSVEITGINETKLYLQNCYIDGTDNTSINVTNSNALSLLFVDNCTHNPSAGNTFITWSGAGVFRAKRCFLQNVTNVVTSTFSSGSVFFTFCESNIPLTFSGSVGVNIFSSNLYRQGYTPATPPVIITATSGTRTISHSNLNGGSSEALTVGASASVLIYGCTLRSSGSAVASGSGSITYGGLTFPDTSNVTVTTQTVVKEGPSKIIGSSNSGNENSLTVQNGSNTASSAAKIISSVAGTSGGDATFQSVVTGAQTWTWGADNDDSDSWILAASSALGTTNTIHVDTSGAATNSLQPAFNVYVGSDLNNVTGDSTTYTIIFNTERFDQNADFNTSTGQFTAPKTGRYSFQTTIRLNQPDANDLCFAYIYTSNKTYMVSNLDGSAVKDFFSNYGYSGAITADMDNGDVAEIRIQTQGASATVDVLATNTNFSGFLAC